MWDDQAERMTERHAGERHGVNPTKRLLELILAATEWQVERFQIVKGLLHLGLREVKLEQSTMVRQQFVSFFADKIGANLDSILVVQNLAAPRFPVLSCVLGFFSDSTAWGHGQNPWKSKANVLWAEGSTFACHGLFDLPVCGLQP